MKEPETVVTEDVIVVVHIVLIVVGGLQQHHHRTRGQRSVAFGTQCIHYVCITKEVEESVTEVWFGSVA